MSSSCQEGKKKGNNPEKKEGEKKGSPRVPKPLTRSSGLFSRTMKVPHVHSRFFGKEGRGRRKEKGEGGQATAGPGWWRTAAPAEVGFDPSACAIFTMPVCNGGGGRKGREGGRKKEEERGRREKALGSLAAWLAAVCTAIDFDLSPAARPAYDGTVFSEGGGKGKGGGERSRNKANRPGPSGNRLPARGGLGELACPTGLPTLM